jgi:hypothetical protein
MSISPADIDQALKKDKAALNLKGKSLTKPGSLLNKARRRAFATHKDIYARLPFPLMEFHNDNGGEFINQVITDDAVVRQYIGCDHLGDALRERLAEASSPLPAPLGIGSAAA